MRYNVEGTVTLTVSVEVEAKDEYVAKQDAENKIKDSYTFNVYGYYHDPDKDIKFDLDAFEQYEESPE